MAAIAARVRHKCGQVRKGLGKGVDGLPGDAFEMKDEEVAARRCRVGRSRHRPARNWAKIASKSKPRRCGQSFTATAERPEGRGSPVTAGGSGAASTATASGPSEAEKREARKALNRIERQLKKLDQQEKKLHDDMVKSTEKNDFDALAQQNSQLKDLADEKDALELEWLEASELLGD